MFICFHCSFFLFGAYACPASWSSLLWVFMFRGVPLAPASGVFVYNPLTRALQPGVLTHMALSHSQWLGCYPFSALLAMGGTPHPGHPIRYMAFSSVATVYWYQMSPPITSSCSHLADRSTVSPGRGSHLTAQVSDLSATILGSQIRLGKCSSPSKKKSSKAGGAAKRWLHTTGFANGAGVGVFLDLTLQNFNYPPKLSWLLG